MSHLEWREILEALDNGKRPEHLDQCAECEAKWSRARGMFLTLRPQQTGPGELQRVSQRILSGSEGRRWRWLPAPRWAWAAIISVFLAGSVLLWHEREQGLEQQVAAVMGGDPSRAPAGLDALMVRETAWDQEDSSEDWFPVPWTRKEWEDNETVGIGRMLGRYLLWDGPGAAL